MGYAFMPKKAENMRATLATEGAGLDWRAINLEASRWQEAWMCVRARECA